MAQDHAEQSPARRLALDVVHYHTMKSIHLRTVPTEVFTKFDGPLNPGMYEQHTTELINI